MMKKVNIIYILIIFFFSNCEKVVDLDLPSTNPKLIIDASFKILFDENPITASTVVKLRLSADYFEDNLPTVTNATVFLTNLNNNTIINFLDLNADGNYEPNSSFIPQENVNYELTVIYNNETFKGNAKRINGTKINNISQGDGTLFSGDEIELEVSFTDNGLTEDYYLIDFADNLYVTIEDRFLNGSEYNFSYFLNRDEVTLPSNRNITLSGITKEYFTYFRILQNQSGQNAGGPFETIPSSLLGNIINTTNEENFPLGYFHISETDTFNIGLIDK